MEIQSKTGHGFTTLFITGSLNAITAPEAETAMAGAIDAGASNLILNLAGLDYISSAGLRALLTTSKRLARQDGRVVLCELQPAVRKILEISGLLSIFAVAGTEAEAQLLAGSARAALPQD